MYRLVYFTVAVCLTGVYTADDFQKCIKLIESDAKNSACCKQEPVKKEFMDKMASKDFDTKHEVENYNECNDLPHDGKECSEKSICIAKKLGLMKDNGDIDKKAIKDMMRDTIEPMMLTEVYHKMEKCLDVDLSKFVTDFSCFFEVLGNCVEIQYVVSCVEWSDEKSCSEMKNTADTCAKMLS